MIVYVKCFGSNKTMSFKVIDNKLLKKYTKIWERVSSLMDIEFDSEPVYGDNDKDIKTKIKSYGDKINTNSQDKKIQKENSSYECLSLIMIDSAIRVNKKCYPQTLLEECKYEIKKNKMDNLIKDDSHLSFLRSYFDHTPLNPFAYATSKKSYLGIHFFVRVLLELKVISSHLRSSHGVKSKQIYM